MKHIKDMFRECCDGAATPGSVLGTGNPCAPDGDCPGSGDTFDHQRRTAKVKKEKRKKTFESLLDVDFDITAKDIFMGSIDKFAEFVERQRQDLNPVTKDEWLEFRNDMRMIAKDIPQYSNSTLMKAFRSKDVTIVSFQERIVNRVKPALSGTDGIEFRKFVKNPLPWTIIGYWCTKYDKLMFRAVPQNHPQILNFKMWDCYVMEPELFDIVNDKMPPVLNWR